METVVAAVEYIATCGYCDEVIFLHKEDFLLLNGERIYYYTCPECEGKTKVMKN